LDVKHQHKFVLKILELHQKIINSGMEVVFCWIPSHVGIPGNEKADAAAKAVLNKEISKLNFPHTDYKQYIGKYIIELWQAQWDMQVNNKLHSIHPNLGEWSKAHRAVRKEEVVLCQLRIGHSHLTHSFLLKGEEAPECMGCLCPFTVKHVLFECADLFFIREKHFSVTSFNELFEFVPFSNIVSFLKEVDIYYKL